MVDLQRSRQKSKKACSSKVSNPVWQHQVTKIFWTKLSYKGVLVKTVSERCPLLEVTSQLTTGTLTHDFHEVKCFWNTGWLEIPLKEDLPFPWQARRPDPQKQFLLLLDPWITPHFYLPELAGPAVQQPSGPWLALMSGWCRWQPASALAGPAQSALAAGW